MAPFRRPETRHDLALAKEVAQYMPEKPQEWEDIAGFHCHAIKNKNRNHSIN